MPGKTGIEKSTTIVPSHLVRYALPYQVWYRGNIVKFFKTRKEAEQVLAKERENDNAKRNDSFTIG